jgi:hypothetical protein
MARPKKALTEKVVTFSVSLLPEDADAITSEAKGRISTPSAFAGALLMRGWKEYLDDGNIDSKVDDSVLYYRKPKQPLTPPGDDHIA